MTARRCAGTALLGLVCGIAACGGPEKTVLPSPPSPLQTSFEVRGVVREHPPNGAPDTPLAKVSVRLTRQSGSATTVETDAAGQYVVSDVSGPATVRFTRAGYLQTIISVDATNGSQIVDAALNPVMWQLKGTILEVAPEYLTVTAARVEIVSGPNRGRVATSDVDGGYRFTNVWGEFDVSVSAGGYQASTAHAVVDQATTTVDVWLPADLQEARSVLTGDLCTIAPPYSWSTLCRGSGPYPLQRSHSVNVSRAGTMSLGVSYRYEGDYYVNQLRVQVLCGAQLVRDLRVELLWSGPPEIMPDRATGPASIQLPQACNYEIKVLDYVADRKGGDWTSYRIDVRYPR